MRGTLYFCLFFLILCLTTATGLAEKHVAIGNRKCQWRLSLDSFRAYALHNSYLVAEIDRDYSEELAKAFETETLSNPELQADQAFTSMALAGANDAQVQVSLGQTLRLSNFGSRSEVARLIRKSSDLQKRVRLMELVQRLTLQYETLLVYQKMETLLRDAEKRAASKVVLIKQGVKKGLFSAGDQYLFEGEKYRLQAEAKGIASVLAVLENQIATSLGSPCLITADSQINLKLIPAEHVLIEQARKSPIGELARMDVLAGLAEEQVKLAQLDSYPQMTPRLVYQHTNDGGDFFGAGISIPLPFWNRNQGAIYKAQAERKVQQVRSEFIKNGGLENQIATLRAAVVAAEEQVSLFINKVAPAFEKAFSAQERLYAEGKGNVLQVWQTLRNLNEVQAQGLQLYLAAKALRIQLSILIGEEI